MPGRRGRALKAVGAAMASLIVAGCGRDDFENEPRPAVPLDVSVKLGEDRVVVAPSEFGAGLTTFTVVNLGDTSATMVVDGPTPVESEEIAPGDTGVVKATLVTGDYEASVDGANADPFDFEVGPERESAQDELLLP